jgi:hypothetical protein
MRKPCFTRESSLLLLVGIRIFLVLIKPFSQDTGSLSDKLLGFFSFLSLI